MLVREVEHVFRDWKNCKGRCRVSIFAGTPASCGLPVVILADANHNVSPSITNAMEQIAAEVLSRYLPDQDGIEPPCVLIAHYPDRRPRGPEALFHDRFFGDAPGDRRGTESGPPNSNWRMVCQSGGAEGSTGWEGTPGGNCRESG
jgi:hypothetical protein